MFVSMISVAVNYRYSRYKIYRIITYISSPALVCNIGEGIDINVLMLYVFCL